MSNSTTSDALYYQPDSKAPPLGIAICLFLAVAVGLIGGLIYAYASWYIPFIYIQVFLTAGFGFLIGEDSGIKKYLPSLPHLLPFIVLGQFGRL